MAVAKLFPYRETATGRLMFRGLIGHNPGQTARQSKFFPMNVGGALVLRGLDTDGKIVYGWPYRDDSGRLMARTVHAVQIVPCESSTWAPYGKPASITYTVAGLTGVMDPLNGTYTVPGVENGSTIVNCRWPGNSPNSVFNYGPVPDAPAGCNMYRLLLTVQFRCNGSSGVFVHVIASAERVPWFVSGPSKVCYTGFVLDAVGPDADNPAPLPPSRIRTSEGAIELLNGQSFSAPITVWHQATSDGSSAWFRSCVGNTMQFTLNSVVRA